MGREEQILEGFRRHGVPFVIVGGYAVNFHGFIRATEDADVVWIRSDESERALLGALIEVDACYIGSDIDPATGIERTYPVSLSFIKANHLMMLCTKHGFIDLFDYVPSLPNANIEEILATSVEDDGYRFVSLPLLRKMKLAAGRTKDKLDLENLPE